VQLFLRLVCYRIKMKEKLAKIAQAAEAEIATAKAEELEAIRVKYLGRKGELTQCLRGLANVPAQERPQVGQLANQLKHKLEELIETKSGSAKTKQLSGLADKEWLDTTILPTKHLLGSRHPLAQLQRKLEAFFTSIGFELADGPHLEDDYHNFEGLNIPPDHPARDAHDTFWLKNGKLLRTHTSTVQVHILEKRKPPFRIIIPGRVYRYEAIDASHENTFNQLEGFMVDEGMSMEHLLGILQTMLEHIFGCKVKVRFRPSYFPFVEPGAELDMGCLLCNAKGCRTCKNTGWIEMLGCGMTHPKVLELGGFDTHKYTGFAFGIGIDRLAMMLHKINDIRLFNGADLRELRQF